MLRLELGEESFDEEAGEFVTVNSVFLEFEHSLVSLSKWESKFEKPFIDTVDKTDEEILWYIRAMCSEPEILDAHMDQLTNDHIVQINTHINAKATATWFKEDGQKSSKKEVVTAEIIYYWMIALQIPFECQHWHINRLMTLVRVCHEKSEPEGKRNKMSRAELAQRNRDLNARRRAELGTSG